MDRMIRYGVSKRAGVSTSNSQSSARPAVNRTMENYGKLSKSIEKANIRSAEKFPGFPAPETFWQREAKILLNSKRSSMPKIRS